MSWKETLAVTVEKIRELDKKNQILQSLIVAQTKRLQQIQESIAKLSQVQNLAADRMADRLIEMSMVQQGLGRDAAVHRQVLGQEATVEEDLWSNENEDAWPPPGHDGLRMP